MKSDGTIGAKKADDDIITNGNVSYSDKNNNKYTDWSKTTRDWNSISNLIYYNDFDFSHDNISEILIGIKSDGTILIDGDIVNFNIHNMDFTNINNAIDANVAIMYEHYSSSAPLSIMFSILKNDGTIQMLNVEDSSGVTSEKNIELSKKIIDSAFSPSNNSLKLLCSDGYVYDYNISDSTTKKLNIGGGNVYIEPYLAITSSGEPHFFETTEFDQCLPNSFKARIYDEIIERID